MLKQDAADLVRSRIVNEKDHMARVRADVRAGRWYEADHVFQGPIFDDAIDYWCADVQIPSPIGSWCCG